MKIFILVHLTIFVLLYFYIILAIKKDEKEKDIFKININKKILFFISFFWEMHFFVWIILTFLRTFLKIKRLLKKQAA